jgi:hypothetical protein
MKDTVSIGKKCMVLVPGFSGLLGVDKRILIMIY